MKSLLRIVTISRLTMLGLLSLSAVFISQSVPAVAETQPQELRDGQHDFDFNFGVWHTHIKRIPDPFSTPTKSVELDGTVTVRKVWDGRAQLEEIETEGPAGHWEGMTLFLYNPQSHQWSQTFIDSKSGVLNSPTIGSFKEGRGELFSQDTFNGKSILVRGVWSNITPNSHRYEESYSNDGGATWAPAFIANLTREKSPVASVAPPFRAKTGDKDANGAHNSEHDFDWVIGTWNSHSYRILHPLTGSTTWTDMDGVSIDKTIWGGRASLAEYKADGRAGHVELLALRWYNPTTHEWNVDFATPNVGTLGVPGVGELKNGRVTFYDQEQFKGRSILVRFSIWAITPDTAQSEQAFSDDGGKTWEVNWVNKFTLVKKQPAQAP
jgi:hypothetical protein